MQKFAVFKISDEKFAIAIERVVEILKMQKLFSIPGLPDFLSGVMNVRGTIVPIIDLRRRFGMKSSGGKKERLIIVKFDKEKIGFHVDEINEILTLEDQEIFKSPSIFKGFKTEYMTGLGKRDENIIILLNIDNVLTSEEKIILKESLESLEVKDA